MNPTIESLEPRRLLTITVANGVLSITGTPGNDEIYVDPNGDGRLRIYFNQQFQYVPAADVQQIRIDAAAGDDYIGIGGYRVNPTYQDITAGVQRSTAAAGSTNDGQRHVSGKTRAKRPHPRVVSGKTLAKRPHDDSAPRIVSGKTLAKRLFVAAEIMVQRSVDDAPAAPNPGSIPVSTLNDLPALILGGDGNDTLHASDSRDTIDGGAGNDWIDGFGGDDVLTGGDGNDTLLGGLGNDLLDGGAGDDRLLANAASFFTQVFARDANGYITDGVTFHVPFEQDGFTDTVIGGSGADTFHTTDAADVQDKTPQDTITHQNVRDENIL
jgi:Ca2+-binding RTX toxin-like protein